MVLSYRENRERLTDPGDEIGTIIRHSWYGSPFRVLTEYPDFPEKHWLQIDPDIRARKVRDLPVFSRVGFPNDKRRYTGPKTSDITRLKGEAIRWNCIRHDSEELRVSFQKAARKEESLRSWPNLLRARLGRGKLVKELAGWRKDLGCWRRKLRGLVGDKLREAANQLRLEAERKFQSLRRHRHELVVFEVDWNKLRSELVEEFELWIKVNRVHDSRHRTGGHATPAVELLKALGAKRLLESFREHQKAFPQPYCAQDLYKAVSDYTRATREAASRPPYPLYRSRKGWNEGEKMALMHMEVLMV